LFLWKLCTHIFNTKSWGESNLFQTSRIYTQLHKDGWDQILYMCWCALYWFKLQLDGLTLFPNTINFIILLFNIKQHVASQITPLNQLWQYREYLTGRYCLNHAIKNCLNKCQPARKLIVCFPSNIFHKINLYTKMP
jgi:hypothetical protein